MANMFYDPERLGRRRLPDNKQYRADLQGRSDLLLSAMQDLIASNYPKSPNTNFGVFYRTLGREFARLQQSMGYINDDGIYTKTRVQFLQQILGERLFLGNEVIPTGYNDASYREYLISIKDAYLKGSSKSSIESSIKDLTGQIVNLKELYLEARKPDSSYTVIDTHKMIVEVFVDQLIASGISLSTISSQLDFYINLIRPAHVLYDTKFIWTETFDINKTHDVLFGDTGGGCVPVYLYDPFHEPTVIAQEILVVSPLTVGTDVFKISSIHPSELTLYLENGIKVIVEPGVEGTKLFGINGKRILFQDLEIDQYIKLTYLVIPGDFQFYWMPPDLVTNSSLRFYKEEIHKPAFQEFVKKLMDSKGRFPVQIRTTETTLCDRWVQDALQPMYEDLRKNCLDRPETQKQYLITLARHMWSPRFSIDNGQGISLSRITSGDTFSFIMPYAPLTDGSGNPAIPSDITVYKDSTQIFGSIETVDASTATISLFNTTAYWDASGGGVPIIGGAFTFHYHYQAIPSDLTASTECLFGISQWQLPNVPVSSGDGSNMLALPSDVRVSVDGTYIPDAVTAINPVLGFITLQEYIDFWITSPIGRAPTIGDVITFDYYQSGTTTYSMLFDDIARVFDDDMVFDGAGGSGDPTRIPVPANDPLVIGYKFRADLLHHASVLNSPDTLLLNNYQKPATRASIINRQDTFNHFNYFFSPEHLYDTNQNIVLNDDYFNEPNEPILNLNAGTPPFQKTYGYQPGLINERKLQDIRQHHHPLMYSDLLLKEYYTGDANVPLSTICDQAGLSFKIRFREELDEISECSEWILFDTATINDEIVTIPSDRKGVINLRVADKKLRSNFILRENAPTGVTSTTYSTYIPPTETQTIFQLPETIPYRQGEDVIYFSGLPVVKRDGSLATADDVIVILRGEIIQGLIKTFDPLTGYVELFDPQSYTITRYIQLTVQDIDRKFFTLPFVPLQADMVSFNIIGGVTQQYDDDFYIVLNNVYWNGTALEDLMEVGDIVRVSYPVYALRDASISFTYNINATGLAKVLDPERSRIFDYRYVFPSTCYDGFDIQSTLKFNEYINTLSDYGSGIKFKYFNKDTFQIEEHVFSGPVFESYDSHEDEISSPESFPNALVKIRNPMTPTNQLDLLTNYDFLNDVSVRIRKKTIRELLPDRTFRISKITEVLPV
jgi:hypothetical protein